jgi:hypothetical protein
MTPKEYAGVFIARRDAEVLRVNGKKPGEGEKPAEKPQGGEQPEEKPPERQPPAPKPERTPPDEGGPAPPEGAPGEAKPAAEKTPTTPVEDRQLSRAIDVLRMLPLVQQFSGPPVTAQTAPPVEKPAPESAPEAVPSPAK